MAKTKEENKRLKRVWWYRGLKKIMKIRYKKPNFIFLGNEFENGTVILSNHEGTDAPMSLEIYLNKPIRMWGASEMNSGLIKLYKYQTKVYYHEKKHWNLFGARMFCLLASPLTNMFYKGLDLISTYRDQRFFKTIKQSIEALNRGENIVIFPEVSDKGYLEQLEGFHPGVVALAEICKRRGIDLPIVVSYFRKSTRTYIFDEPILYSQLSSHGETKEQICEKLCKRCNELGQMLIEKEKQTQEEKGLNKSIS